MNVIKTVSIFLFSTMILTSCSFFSNDTGDKNQELNQTLFEKQQQKYLDNVNTDYAYDFALKLAEIKDNAALGYRTAGSKGELAAGQLIHEEMDKIGLSDITKDEIVIDTWEFEKAQLSYTQSDGSIKMIELGGYQANFDTQGIKEYKLIYGKKGTEDDLSQLNVKDKLVLIEINQRDDWWINYPAYEAHLKGAAGIIAYQNGGYSEVSDDALNAQDICGPADAPAFSISANEAKIIIDIIENSLNKEIDIKLDAKSTVGLNGKSYNIFGSIPGKNSDSMVLMSSHYDSYFDGFQDDNIAVGMMLGIAKAIKDSGYQPEKTLVFCAMSAEEWGATNTRYDWSTGAFNQIFRARPEWVGKTIANINIELPAIDDGDKNKIRTTYELKTFTENFIPKIPKLDGVFSEGVEVIVPTYTWSDDFSLAIAGIPSSVTALRGEFSKTHYHTQYDNKDTYSEKALKYHLNMYGMLMMEYDKTAIAPLDFTIRMVELKESLDNDTLSKTSSNVTELKTAIDSVISKAKDVYNKLEKLNQEYLNHLDNQDDPKANEILNETRELNKLILELFKYSQDSLVRLTWEDEPIFPHEHSQNNLIALESAIDELKRGNIDQALDEYLYLIDNNAYAYDFSRETFSYFSNYVINQPKERLFWGAGRVQGHEDLFNTINSLKVKLNEKNDDVSAEISSLTKAYDNQQNLLEAQIMHELNSLNTISQKFDVILNLE